MALNINYILLVSVYLSGLKILTTVATPILLNILRSPISLASINLGIETTVSPATTSSKMTHYHINLPNLVNRSDWEAKEPKLIENFNGPAPYVIIHHSYIPAACETTENCKKAMRSMQSFHQDDRGWNDVGYSFAIGGDGKIYFGRGFNVIGAHAPKYNNKSVGICLIGDWRTELPSQKMLKAVHELIDYGVTNGYIDKEYILHGHRQVRDTECPGERLFNEISKWPHFLASSPLDLNKNKI